MGLSSSCSALSLWTQFQKPYHSAKAEHCIYRFLPPLGGHIYVDPDLKSFIKPTQEFKDMVDSLSGSHLEISTAASPQLFVALNSTLLFITSDMATNHTFRCHLNECAHNLMQSFQEISNREQVLIATYREISPTPQPVPNPPVPTETTPSDALLTTRTRRNVRDIFFGQSTATLAAKVRTHITTRDVIGRDIIRQAR